MNFPPYEIAAKFQDGRTVFLPCEDYDSAMNLRRAIRDFTRPGDLVSVFVREDSTGRYL